MLKKRPAGLDVLAKEELDAWADYLSTTSEQPLERYVEVEPWAWNRLNQRLAAINAKREKILEDDAA